MTGCGCFWLIFAKYGWILYLVIWLVYKLGKKLVRDGIYDFYSKINNLTFQKSKMAIFGYFLPNMAEFYILWLGWCTNLVRSLLEMEYMTFNILTFQKSKMVIFGYFLQNMAEFYILWLCWCINLVRSFLEMEYMTFNQN